MDEYAVGEEDGGTDLVGGAVHVYLGAVEQVAKLGGLASDGVLGADYLVVQQDFAGHVEDARTRDGAGSDSDAEVSQVDGGVVDQHKFLPRVQPNYRGAADSPLAGGHVAAA